MLAQAKAAQVAELMLSEFRRLAADGITDDELARAQGQLGGASALALEDSDTRMTRLGRSELTFGEFSDLDETLRRIAGVTAADMCGARGRARRAAAVGRRGRRDRRAGRSTASPAPPDPAAGAA